jgi:NADH-quinone oxidoreductase subunit M
MNLFTVPWIELAVVLALAGALVVSRIREPIHAFRWGLVFTALVLLGTASSWLTLSQGRADEPGLSVQPYLFGRTIFVVDNLAAPLVTIVALLHFLVAIGTSRAHMRRFSVSWSLVSEAVVLATLTCREPWVLVGLLLISTLPPIAELTNRERPLRVYLWHMAVFAVLLVGGWALIEHAIVSGTTTAWWISLPLLMAILVRCGTIPAHCWVTDWFEHASPGIAMLHMLPLLGVYAAVRLVLPVAPAWVLQSIGLVSLLTALYAAAMAMVQRDTRRFFAYVFLSHSALVLVGLELHTELSLTACFCLWLSVMLSLGGFGISLRAVEARFGRLSLSQYHGLYSHSPMLATSFLVSGLGAVGFPFTVGFIATEILVDSAVVASPYIGVAVVATGAFNGIAVLRAYLAMFTGAKHTSSVALEMGLRERFAVLALVTLVLAGGVFPQPGVISRDRAAKELLDFRFQTPTVGARPPRAAKRSGRDAPIGPKATRKS